MFEKERTLVSEFDNQFIPDEWTFENVFKIIQAPFVNIFFPWVIIILIINRNKWKRSIIYILLFHYILRSLGDVLRAFSDAYPVTKNRNANWPHSRIRFNIGCIIAYVSWISGEIIGDWYPSIRAIKIVHSKFKKTLLKISCILYNITKILSIAVYIYHGNKMEFKNSKTGQDSNVYKALIKQWWVTIILNFIFCFINDACVIYALKTEVFNKLKTLKERSFGFVEKFKQISELRIIISMIISICFVVFTIPMVLIKFKEGEENGHSVENVFSQYDFNLIRNTVINFNHIMMYIDQVLLKYLSTYPKKMPKLNNIPDTPNTPIEFSNNKTPSFSNYSKNNTNYSNLSNKSNVPNFSNYSNYTN